MAKKKNSKPGLIEIINTVIQLGLLVVAVLALIFK